MTDASIANPLPGITALPPTTARQIGSGQVLVDTSSVVKELIDNALDARAKTIFVDITANTLDSIQVKDDGHGIPAEDRALVCRRYCTSKIRDLKDLKEVGGRWLGFRGEALSSMAELSGTLSVTTRVEGEPVAVKLKYGRDGELLSTERDSHPVGTTVKATQFFELIPVRKQTAVKNAAKCLAKMRRLIQAYALARPAVRFRLHVLKAKTNKGDFMFAPKANSNVEDAVLKVIGKDCALQCDWTALESDGFEIHAFLPKPTANAGKIANHGAFISIDSRPVSSTRGAMKTIVAVYRERLRKSSRSLASVKDPFFCMNILCPPESYNPNIEPAKDDVMFDDGEVVLNAVDKLFRSYYPEAIEATEGVPNSAPSELPSSDRSHADLLGDVLMLTKSPISIYEDPLEQPTEQPAGSAVPEPFLEQPRWRSSMYGIDEDDMEFLQENQPPVLEEEEGSRSATVSNPWTIARLNSPVKRKTAIAKGQLLSPTKSHIEDQGQSSSPMPLRTPARDVPVEPMTPQTSSRPGIPTPLLDHELEKSIQHVVQSRREEPSSPNMLSQPLTANTIRERGPLGYVDQQSSSLNAPEGLGGGAPSRPLAPITRSRPKKRRAQPDDSSTMAIDGPNDTWFGQPMRGSAPVQQSQRQRKRKVSEIPLFPTGQRRSTRRLITNEVERTVEPPLFSENNTDIRSFFGQNVQNLGRSRPSNSRASSAGPLSRSENVRDHSLRLPNDGTGSRSRNMADQSRAQVERERPSSQPSTRRLGSINLPYRPYNVHPEMHIRSGPGHDQVYQTPGTQFQPYDNVQANRPLQHSMSVDSELPRILPQHSNGIRSALDLYRVSQPSNNARDTAVHFAAYQDREKDASIRATSPIRRPEPRIPPAHKVATRSRPSRRRTTDGAQRTKSSKLPLERVPHGYHVQNVVLPLQLSIASIVYSTRKLDMSRNSVEWGYSADEAYDALAAPVAESKIMQWVIKLDGMLCEHYERLDGVETFGLLHEAIQRGLDARKADEAMDVVEELGPGPVMSKAPVSPLQPVKVETGDFDMSQFVDLDIGMDRIDDDDDGARSVVMGEGGAEE